jgi:prevent-host-death family protein
MSIPTSLRNTTEERGLSIAEARSQFTQLPEQLEECGALTVTRRGKPVMALMSYDLYASLVETLEVMGDAELMAALRRSVADVKAGRVLKWEDAKKRLTMP